MQTIKLYESVGDETGYVSYIQHMGNDGLTIVNAARASFNVEKEALDERDKKLISYLCKHQHTSVFEHNIMTFKFHVPLFVARQHMRHRTWSYNEVSRRYTKVGIEFYNPSFFRTQHASNRQASNLDKIDPIIKSVKGTNYTWDTSCSQAVKAHAEQSLKLFDDMIAAGVAKEQARMVLPQNLYTTYWGTVNLSNLWKFYKLRTHEGAQWEIQQVANACIEIAKKYWPQAIEALLENNL